MNILAFLSLEGPLMGGGGGRGGGGGGSPMSLSILRNGNVPCHYILNVPVDFKIVQCRLSNLRKDRVALSNLRNRGHLRTLTNERRLSFRVEPMVVNTYGTVVSITQVIQISNCGALSFTCIFVTILRNSM